MSSIKLPPSSPSTSTSAGSACASSEDYVNSKVMGYIHTARDTLNDIENLVHFHGDKHRLEAERKLVELKDKINKIYIECLQCPGGDGES